MRDLTHLYHHLLREPATTGAIPVTVRMVLDTKHFVKDYNEGFVTMGNGGIGR
jgi:hypothetical protein